MLAIGVLYANYLGGDEGYTASACDGKNWFDQLFWLGVNRAPPGWHKWTFDFDPEAGLQVLHNDKEVTAVDSRQDRLEGFQRHRRSGATTARAASRRSGWPTCPSRWAAR